MKKSVLLLSSLLSLFWLGGVTEANAQKHEALKAIDPSQAAYDTPPPAPSIAPPATNANGNPFGGGIQGQPLGGPKRTLDNPNPNGVTYLREDPQPAPGIPTQAGQGWSPPAGAAVDNRAYEQRVARLEQITFGSPYPEHDVEDRIEHLESEVFSKKNTGMPLEARLGRLETKLLGQTAFGQTANVAPPAQAPFAQPQYAAPNNMAYAPPAQSGYYPVTQPPQFRPPTQSMPPYQQPYGQRPMQSMPPAQGMGGGMGGGMSQPMPMQGMQGMGGGMSQSMPMQGMQGMGGGMGQQMPMQGMQGMGGGMGQQMPMQGMQGMGGGMGQQMPMQGMQGMGGGMSQPMPVQGMQGMGGGMSQPMPVQGMQGMGGGMSQPMPVQGIQGMGGGMGQQMPMQGMQGMGGGMSQPMPVQGMQGMGGGMSQPMPVQGMQGMGGGMSQPMPVQGMQGMGGGMSQSMPVRGTQGVGGGTQIAAAPSTINPTRGAASGSSSGSGFGLSPSDRKNADMESITKSIPQKLSAGDYFSGITKFASGSVARWTTFPVLVHLPMGSPANWNNALDESVSAWGKYIPVRVAMPSEAADVEIAWINHLPPRQMGQTNLEVFNGRMRVTVYLLRPSYYLAGSSEKSLRKVAEHEIGHALGIFGHSSDINDLMYPIENASGKDTKSSGITARDLNTLRKIYESTPLPSGYQSPHPMGWSLRSH